MSRRRAKNHPSHARPQSYGLLDYFFEGADASKPRTELVSREELWRILETYHEQVILQNTWRRRLWRMLKRWPSATINPFAMMRIARLRAKARREKGVQP
jgi:hypothetical protein